MSTQSTELSRIDRTASVLAERANAIQVIDQASHDEAGELYVRLGELIKEIDAVHDPSIAAAHAAHKAALAAKARLTKPVDDARRILKPKVVGWEQEQKRLAEEVQRKALEEARRQEEEARLALAAEAQAAGATAETVDEILDTPMQVVTPVAQPAYQKVNGFTSREVWSAEVVDLKALCRAIADAKQPSHLVEPNMTALNGIARSLKSVMAVPGVKAVKRMV